MKANFLPRLQDILFFAIFLAVLTLGARMLNMDGDLPRHLLTGKFILENKTVPNVELFAYPYQGRAYVAHEWLSDVLFFLVQSRFGLAGLILLAAGLLASAFTALYIYSAARLAVRLPVLLLFLWGAALSSLNWVIRPHLISMLLLALWLIWSDKLARGEKFPLWPFFAAMIAWSNLHGEFIAGMLVLFAYSAGWSLEFFFNPARADRQTGARLWSALLLSGLASLLNPATYHPYLTLIGFVGNRYLMSRMAEANPPDFSRPEFLILLGLLAVSIVLLALHPRRMSAGQAFLLAGFSVMSLLAARNIHLYGLVAPFVLAETSAGLTSFRPIGALESILRKVEGQVKATLWPLVTVIFLGALILSSRARNLYIFEPTFFPTQAVDWLEKNPQPGRMFNDLNWGGYLALRLWPQQQVFADSMADVTGELTQQYETLLTLRPGWQEILTRYAIRWAILPPAEPLLPALQSLGWREVYRDSTAVILNDGK